MPALARAWQMLLKGHDEVRESPRPLAAADMVLVRLALCRRSAAAGRTRAPPWRMGPGPRRPILRAIEAVAQARARDDAQHRAAACRRPRQSLTGRAPPHQMTPRRRTALQLELKSFEDVVALAEAKRDLKLKHALVEQVRLVRFKPGPSRSIRCRMRRASSARI